MQLVRRDAGVRVLVCSPSNAAADLLAERLEAVGMDSDKLYRLDAPSLYEEDILEDVQTLSLFPGQERLLAFRVVLDLLLCEYAPGLGCSCRSFQSRSHRRGRTGRGTPRDDSDHGILECVPRILSWLVTQISWVPLSSRQLRLEPGWERVI